MEDKKLCLLWAGVSNAAQLRARFPELRGYDLRSSLGWGQAKKVVRRWIDLIAEDDS